MKGKYLLYLFLFLFYFLPSKAFSQNICSTGQIIVGSGYFHSPYYSTLLRSLEKQIESSEIDSDSVSVMNVDRTKTHDFDFMLELNIRLYYDKFGLGLGTGVMGVLNSADIYYAKDDDISGGEKLSKISQVQLSVTSFVLPQNLTLNYFFNLSRDMTLNLGVGGGCLILINRVSYAYENGAKASEYKLPLDYSSFKRYFDIEAMIEFSYMYLKNVSIEIGIKGQYAFMEDAGLCGVFLYGGVSEHVDII